MSRKQREKRARARTKTQDGKPKAVALKAAEPAKREGRSVNKLGVVVAVVGLVGLMAFVMLQGGGAPPPEAEVETPPVEVANAEEEQTAIQRWQAAFLQDVPFSPERDFFRGPEDAPVTLIEFSDFQCPFCRKATGSLDEVLKIYPDDVRWVFKNFPLDITCNKDMAQQLHPSGCKAAVMARCAGAEDSELFWRFHDAVFASDDLSDDTLAGIAEGLGLTSARFTQCVEGEETLDDVLVDIAAGRKLGVSATPTIFINGRAAPSYDPEKLADIIDFIRSKL